MGDVLATLGVIGIVIGGILAVVSIYLAYRLVRKYKEVHGPDTPPSAKVAFWVSLVYAVFPVDALPDPIYLDDIVVLFTGLLYVNTQLRQKVRARRVTAKDPATPTTPVEPHQPH